MECLMEWKNCSYYYHEGENVLESLSTKIHANERIAVIGGNGAGKSTFFLGCIGIVRPQRGEIFFRGQKLQYTKKELLSLRQQLGLVFQEPDDQLIAPTVEGELSFGPLNMGMKREEVRREVERILEEWGLLHMRRRPPHYLSGGEKKRVSLCDILVMKPQMLLLDEPTASLDCKNARVLKQQLNQLHKQGMTLMISTHDMDFVWEWAERVIVFADGRIVADGSPEEFFKNDSVIEKAGIQKPLLYQMAQAVCCIKQLPSQRNLPRTQKDFANWLSLVL